MELESALDNSNIDIIELSEVRRNGETIMLTKNKNLFCHFGSEGGQKGVGFIVKSHLVKNLFEFKGITDRIAILKLKFEHGTLNMIQVYAPTASSDEKKVKNFM